MFDRVLDAHVNQNKKIKNNILPPTFVFILHSYTRELSKRTRNQKVGIEVSCIFLQACERNRNYTDVFN